jgi:hypothetical protein
MNSGSGARRHRLKVISSEKQIGSKKELIVEYLPRPWRWTLFKKIKVCSFY